jgi:FAD/FMN-containing dehydrogenase
MKVKTLTGGEYDLKQELVDNFKLRVRGQVLLEGEASFDTARAVWNGIIDRRPALIVRCLGVSDVITAVQFAREHNLLICIKGGGHNIAGLATADGVLMLDMSLMRGVWVDAPQRVAHAQPGCLLGDVDRETQLYGLAAVLGFVSQTGIAGLTLGGGFGYLTRRWGWTADNVAGMDLVTANGQHVRADRDENPDLFWALRGGGGNFGVVTGIDYALHAVGPEVIGGIVAWPAAEAPNVLELYCTLAEAAPRELTLVAFMRLAPPAPWLPMAMHGKLIVAILACYSGEPAEGEKFVASIKAFGRPVGDVLVRRPYVQMQALLDATQPAGRRYYWKSEYLAQVNPALCEQVMAYAAKIQSPHSSVILFQIGGALNSLEEAHSPVGNRTARYVVNITGSWERPDQDGANITWAREAWAAIKPFSTGGTYLNFLTADEGPDRTQSALGQNLQRLAEVKAVWDPENVFRNNWNIQPAGVVT